MVIAVEIVDGTLVRIHDDFDADRQRQNLVKNKRFPICFAIVGIVNGINGKSAFAKSVIEELSFRETTRVNHLGRPVAVYAAKMLEIMFPP